MRALSRPRRSTLAAVLLTLLSLTFAGCGGPDDGAPPRAEPAIEPQADMAASAMNLPAEVPVGSWVLESFGDETPAGEGSITLQFLPEGRAAGSSGCNRYMGPFETDGSGGLSFGLLGSTMMACPQEIMDRERHYLAMLEKVSAFRLAGERLALMSVEGQDLLVFGKAEETDGETAPGEEVEP